MESQMSDMGELRANSAQNNGGGREMEQHRQSEMSRKDKLWIAAMEWCGRYCGCHQMPERSFSVKGYQFPLCARCTPIMSRITAGVWSRGSSMAWHLRPAVSIWRGGSSGG